MDKKKSNLPMICNLVLMAGMIVLCFFAAHTVFTSTMPEGFKGTAEIHKAHISLLGFAHIFNAMALACGGIIYTLKGGSKQAAVYYKTFILLTAVSSALRLIGTIVYPGFGFSDVLLIGILLLLLILAFAKDLGEKITWILFCLTMILEVVLAIVTFDKDMVLVSIVSSVSRLVLLVSIGFSIRAKYLDKKERGSK